MDINKLKCIIGNKIYDIRDERDLTQEEFTSKLNIYFSRGHLSKIEKGLIMPSAEFIREVCRVYGISPAWLLTLDNNDTSNVSPKEQRLLNSFNSLSVKKQALILDLLECMLE